MAFYQPEIPDTQNFDSDFTSLLEQIHHEKRDQLVNQFLDLHEDKESLENLIDTFTKCLSVEEQLQALKNSIKAHWDGNIRALIGEYHESTLRQLCTQLGIHQEGGHEALLGRVEKWLRHDQPDAPDSVISKNILESYLNQCSGSLTILCDELDLKVDRRSPQKMRNMLAGRLDLELNFYELSFETLKSIAHEALGEDVAEGLKKKELIETLTAAYERGRHDLSNEADASR